MEGGGRGSRARGRGRARGPVGGRGRGYARGGGRARGRARGQEAGRAGGRGHGIDAPQAGNGGLPEDLLNVNFGIPEHLANQNQEVDELNAELSSKYVDMQNLRDSIAGLRVAVPNDRLSHEKLIEVVLDQYREMRSSCAKMRDRIRRMDPPGIPFDEHEGFDVMP